MDYFYHVSKNSYEMGKEIFIPQFQVNNFQSKNITSGNVWIEDELEKTNPNRPDIRKTSIFLFDNPFAAVNYGENELTGNTFYIYKVSANDTVVKCIMVACDLIGKYKGNGSAIQKLCNEYWSPTKKYFKFHEYLTEKVVVVGIEDINTIRQATSYSSITSLYMDDYDTCESILT